MMYDAKGSFSGDPGVGYFPGERSEPVFLGAAGENFADFKAEMAYFMCKMGHQRCLRGKPKLSGISS